MHQNRQFQTLMNLIPLAGLVFAGILPVPFAAAAQDDVARHAVDIVPIEAGETKEIDAHSVAVTSDGTQLTLVFDAGQDVEEYLRNNQAGSIAEVWIDTDRDTTTGGAPFFSDAGGFEYAAKRVYVCKEFENGSVCTGDVSDVEITRFFSTHTPVLWDPAIEDFSDVYEMGWDGDRQDIDGAHVTLHIPYEEFKGTPGQTIRLLIIASSHKGSTFPEVQLELK